ncbi:hypothetical protein DND132_2401 [Pseudodesulfovibrio mercurii]|uniref:Uncharacterized protein n=1 Tax=Pseudodesulfovibrio mercurii TaxID=641491 RepID=F0JC31_9BACT|nr:hypothetical protein [Pseudodesulfovibrio mercurii]EGB15604.1 hypothetical protein DND132_2401 [Pseudodesulfovibrio mercurii]
MCAVPVQLVVAMLWRCSYPPFIVSLPQPTKGLVLTLITVVGTAIVAYSTFVLVGKSVGPPTPMLIQYSILSIVVTFWMVPLMQGWPLKLFLKNPLLLGAGTLVACYVIAYALFRWLFDFSFLAGAPVYVETLDPKGLVNAWSAISFFVTLSCAILVLALSEMTLVTKLIGKRSEGVVKIVATLIVLCLGLACWNLFVKGFGMDTVVYLVKIPVCFIFGVFLADSLMQHRLFASMGQPRRGLSLALLSAVYAFVMYYVYAAVAPFLAGVPLPSGSPTYDLELWLANALLSITFPVIVAMTEYFEFWPIRR